MRERRRSGLFHWAFGAQISADIRAEVVERGLPDGHFDVHNRFSTMILELAGGEEVVFIDKGRMITLNDPEVRTAAARYGDPDTFLREAWVAPMPGINVPGDYFEDYASDPVSWIASEYERFFSGN